MNMNQSWNSPVSDLHFFLPSNAKNEQNNEQNNSMRLLPFTLKTKQKKTEQKKKKHREMPILTF